MIVKGKLIHCKREEKTFDTKRKSEVKLFITLAEAEITDEQMEECKEAFKDSGKKFTPEWVLNFTGYINTSTKFELPYEDINGERFESIEDGISDGLKYIGADVRLSLNIKEGAIYPVAIKFLSEGKAYNPFEEFDNE